MKPLFRVITTGLFLVGGTEGAIFLFFQDKTHRNNIRKHLLSLFEDDCIHHFMKKGEPCSSKGVLELQMLSPDSPPSASLGNEIQIQLNCEIDTSHTIKMKIMNSMPRRGWESRLKWWIVNLLLWDWPSLIDIHHLMDSLNHSSKSTKKTIPINFIQDCSMSMRLNFLSEDCMSFLEDIQRCPELIMRMTSPSPTFLFHFQQLKSSWQRDEFPNCSIYYMYKSSQRCESSDSDCFGREENQVGDNILSQFPSLCIHQNQLQTAILKVEELDIKDSNDLHSVICDIAVEENGKEVLNTPLLRKAF